MDGYALRAADLAAPGARLTLVGESAAGHGYDAPLGAGETVRIFTGAPVPEGADTILLQEDADRRRAPASAPPPRPRPAVTSARAASISARATRRCSPERGSAPSELALAAAINHPLLPVARRPRVALIASGDELVPPGAEPGPSQIIACNGYAVAAIAEAAGRRGDRPRHFPRRHRRAGKRFRAARARRRPMCW